MVYSKKKKQHQDRLRQKAVTKDKKKKRSKIVENSIFITIVGTLITLLGSGLFNIFNDTINRNFNYHKEVYEQLYIPVYADLFNLDEPLTLNRYLAVINENVHGKEKLLHTELLAAWYILQKRQKEYLSTPIIVSDNIKRKKEAELLVAARQFEARFNERFQLVTKRYFSNMGEKTPDYSDLLLAVAIKPFDNGTTLSELVQIPLLNSNIR